MMNRENFVHYTLGVPEMDAEHWNLFELLNQLRTAINERNVELANDILSDFEEGVESHILHEERLMKKWSYPYVNSHANDYPVNVHRLIDGHHLRHDRHDRQVLYTDCTKMEVELSHHIDWHDMQYVPYYRKWIATNTSSTPSHHVNEYDSMCTA